MNEDFDSNINWAKVEPGRPVSLTGDQTAMIFTGKGAFCITNETHPNPNEDIFTVPEPNRDLAYCAWAMRQRPMKMLFIAFIKALKHKALTEPLEPQERQLFSILLGWPITDEKLEKMRANYKKAKESGEEGDWKD